METSKKRSLSLSPEDIDSSGAPVSRSLPAAGTGAPAQPDDEQTTRYPRALAQAVLLEHFAEYRAAWPDQPHPALRGETPRQVATSPDGRDEVETLIRELELQARGTPVADAWDFERLRAELGLAAALSGRRRTKALDRFWR
jgi:hypothetical protein